MAVLWMEVVMSLRLLAVWLCHRGCEWLLLLLLLELKRVELVIGGAWVVGTEVQIYVEMTYVNL